MTGQTISIRRLKAIEVARARREPRVPTLKQIHDTIAAMPSGTPVEMRNRAVVAFTILTGSRDNATASLRLKHVDLDARVVHLDGRYVRTMFAKTFELLSSRSAETRKPSSASGLITSGRN